MRAPEKFVSGRQVLLLTLRYSRACLRAKPQGVDSRNSAAPLHHPALCLARAPDPNGQALRQDPRRRVDGAATGSDHSRAAALPNPAKALTNTLR